MYPRAIVTLTVLGMLSGALLWAQEPAPEDYKPGSGSLTVVVEDHTWTDAARKRDVPVRVYAPDFKHGRGPFPTVVFSHGGGESRASFTYLGKHWARNGYLVVFLTHQGSDDVAYREMFKTRRQPDPEKFIDRPLDISFVLDRLLSKDQDIALLKGRIDSERLSVSGQCAGTSTALGTVGLTVNLPGKPKSSFPDKRVKAVVALGPQLPYPAAGGGKFGVHEQSWATINKDTPVLMVTGTKDFTWIPEVRNKPDLCRLPWDHMPGTDKYLVDLAGGKHHAFTDSVPVIPYGDRDPRHHEWIQQATTAFFDAYLKNDRAALAWLQNKALDTATKGEGRQEHRLAEKKRPKAEPTKQAEPAPAKRPEDDQATLYKGGSAPPHAVGTVERIVLRDKERGKDLALRVIYPKAEGKFPLILFSHYLAGSKEDYDRLISDWAGHGFVSILPDHVGKDLKDMQWRQRAQDLRLVLDSLDEIQRQAPVVKGKMDVERIGVGGHLIGAHSAGLLAGMKMFGAEGKAESFADKRIKAVLMLSPTGRGQGLTDDSWKDMKLPMLVMTGSKNPSRRTGNDPLWRTEPFRFSSPGDKYLVFIEGLDGTYGGLLGKDPKPGELAPYVQASTLAFWDAYLKGSKEAQAYLESDKLPALSKRALKLERK